MINFNFLNSLKSRILFIIISGSILIISSIVSYYLYIIIKQKKEENKNALINISEKNAQIFSTDLISLINISKTLAYTFEEYEQIPEAKRRTVLGNFILNNLKSNEDIIAIWTKFKPYTIDKLDTLFEDKVLGTSGQYFKCYYRNKNEILEKEIKFSDEVDFEMQEYFSFFQDNRSNYLQAPLLNFYNESFIDTSYVISLLSPVYDDNNFIGVVGIDVKLSQLFKKFNSSSSTYFLLNDETKIVYHSNNKLVNKFFNNIYPDLTIKYKLNFNFSEGNSVYMNEKVFDDDIISQVVLTPLYFETTDQTFIFGQKSSIIKRDKSLSNILVFTIIISVSFLIFVVILSLLISNILENILSSFKIFLKNISLGIFKISENEYNKFSSKELREISSEIKTLTSNLARLEEFADEIKIGNLEAEYKPLSDKDKIGYSLLTLKNNLKLNIENQEKRQKEDEISKWVSQGVANFGDILRKNLGNLESLSFETISQLVRYLDAVQGGIFIYNDYDKQNVFLELTALFAYDRRRYEKKSIQLGEGLIGTCAQEKKTIHLKKIPGNYIEISSGMGKTKPNEAIIVPLLSNLQVFGIMEIAKLGTFESYQIEFAEKIAENIASTLASAKISSQTSVLLEKANFKYEKLLISEKDLEKKYKNLEENFYKIQELEKEKSNIVNTLNEISLYAEFDINFKVIKINSNFLKFLKQTYDEALSKNYYEIFNVELENFDEHSRRLSNIKNGQKQEFIFSITVAREKLWLKAVFNPIYDADRKISRFLLFAFDHTLYIIKENEIKKLIEETQLKEEQIDIQEQEMLSTFEELNTAKEEINNQKEEKNSLFKEIERHEKRIEFYKREIEKRIDRFKKIELTLKEKVKNLEEELNKKQ